MILNANALHIPLADNSVQCCVTSPPYYGLRDYGTASWEGGNPVCNHEPDKSSKSSTLEGGKDTQGSAKFFRTTCSNCGAIRIDKQIGLEPTPDEYVANLVSVFREVKRVLRDDGTCWLNLGDSFAGSGMGAANYPDSASEKQKSNHGSTTAKGRGGMTYGLKAKDMIGIPWMVAFALRADGWYLRSDIIWHKPNPMPESVTDRPTKSHEYLFLLTKSAKYYYDNEAIKEPSIQPNDDRGRASGFYPMANKRSVWTINTQPTSYAHFATFPEKLVEPCILAGSKVGDFVLDPFSGSGTTGRVAIKHNREFVGTELNFKYIDEISHRRLTLTPLLF